MLKTYVIMLGLLSATIIYSTGDSRWWDFFARKSTEPRSNFFKHVMGVPESVFKNFSNHANSIRYNAERKVYELHNTANNTWFQAGFFKGIALQELRSATAQKSASAPGTFNVIAARSPSHNQELQKKVDVAALQADVSNNDAVFQVASNFNTLEPISLTTLPEAGISDYIYDHTQGPAAVISAAPGIILRAYYMFYNPQTPVDQWRQTSERQYNLLAQVGNYFPVRNGYVVLTEESLKKTLPPSVAESVMIGFHRDIQVTFGQQLPGDTHVVVTRTNQIVHQVFAAGLDLGYGSGSSNYSYLKGPNKDEVVTRAKLLLGVAYEGALRATIAHGKKKLFLTLIGGGVFANNLGWIGDALAKNTELIKTSGVEVNLVIYDLNAVDAAPGGKSLLTTLRDMVAATKGTFVVHE